MTASVLLVFARCAGFAARAPGFSHPSVPHPLRAGIALLLTVAIAPGVRATHLAGIALAIALVVEFLLGSAIGMGASLLYDGAYAGGRMLDDYVGVKAIAPNVQLVAPSGFGRIWSIAFTGGYFLLGAYRLTILALAESFERIPPGAPFDPHAWLAFAASLASTIVLVAFAVAAPSIALAFVVQIALAALSRTIPRFAGFSLSFPLVFGAVLLVTAVSIPLLAARAAHPILLYPGARP
ncbi:MAG TPA: flagellar biosynthetic protein FliR [Candidatus Baltobacteraceae bacterium]|nr:flagellar biosynthetic protein FliR [Candidatus Baltobacteraceae bacterium]